MSLIEAGFPESVVDVLRDDEVLTAADPEFSLVVTSPVLSAEWALVRATRVRPTAALADGSARSRRDSRIAWRRAQAGEVAA